ncbi:MAG: glycosyltransferase family 39 protein [Anaerolineae bacterium]
MRFRFRHFTPWLLLLLAVWGLWLHRLAARDLSFDEAATWYIAQRPLPEMISYLREAIYEHPPVYYTLMHFWIEATGTGEFTLRLFSVMVGLTSLPLLGWATRRTLAGAMRGLIPAFLLAAMPGFVYYARNARMYTLGVVWVVLSSGIFLRGWLNARSWSRWQAFVLLGIVHLLAIFTHYYLLLPILVQPVILLLLRRWRPLLAWAGLHSLLALPGLVWLAVSPGLQASARGFRLFPQAPPLQEVAQLLRLLLFSQEVRPPFPTLYTFLALTGFGLLLALIRKPSSAAALWLACLLLLPLALVYQLPRAPAERYVLFLFPPLAWALSFLPAAAFRLPRPWWPAGALLSLALAGGLSTNGLSHVLNPREGGYGHTLRRVQLCAQPKDGVLFYGPWQWLLFRYYDPGGLPPITTLPPQAPPRLSPEEAKPVLEDLIRRYNRLWVVPAAVDDVDPSHFVEGWLNTHAHPVWRTADFMLYLPPLPSGVPSRSIGAVFNETLRLEKVEWEATTLPAGHPLRFTLHWVSRRPLSGNVRVSLMLRDRSGNTWDEAHVIPGEWAHPPSQWQPGESILDRQGLMIPAGAPPGDYTVYLLVVDERTKEPLQTSAGSEIALFPLQVEEPPAEEATKARSCVFPEPTPLTFCSPEGVSCLTLVSGGSPEHVYPGYPIPITLHWTVPRGTLPDLSLRLEVASWRNVLGLPPSLSVTVPVTPDYPPSRWSPGRLVTQKLSLPFPVETPAGPALLRLTVIGPDGKPWSTPANQQSISLGNLMVQRRPVLRHLPSGMRRIRVAFGDAVELRGYRIEGEARPGGTLRLTYIWHARERPPAVYAVFNHLMTADGVLVAQQDGQPQGGRWPTTHWLSGDDVEDHYILAIPSDAPPGPYRLSVGMYDAMTGERLPAVQEGQRLPEDRLFLPLPDN